MSLNNEVHFALTSQELIYPYYLSIVSALKTQKASKFTLWGFSEPVGKYWDAVKGEVDFMAGEYRDFPALEGKPEYFQYAVRKDIIEYRVLHERGGLFLDLDTFCIQDVMCLMNSAYEVFAGLDCSFADYDYPFNMAAVLAYSGSSVMLDILLAAEKVLQGQDMIWGDTGPKLFSAVVRANASKVRILAEGVLGGHGEKAIGIDNIYHSGNTVADHVHVIHLYHHSDEASFNGINEDYIASSDSFYANIVRQVLTSKEWRPERQVVLSVEKNIDTQMPSDNIVHFILVTGELTYGYYLSIVSALATQHADKFVLWSLSEPTGKYWPLLKDRVELQLVKPPDIPTYIDGGSLEYTYHAKNYLTWYVLYKHGGITLDLDTFCLADVTKFLSDSDKELVLPDEVENTASNYPFFNSSIVMAHRQAPLMKEILNRADALLKTDGLKRGVLSVLLHYVAKENLQKINTIPYGVCGGGGDDCIVARLAETEGQLWEQARILHLFGNHSPFFNELSEEFIRDSDILFARTVRETLSLQSWGPILNIEKTQSTPCPQSNSNKTSGRVVRSKRFHLPCLPHVAANKRESLACAFSQKVIKMGQMLKSLGHTVYCYGVEGSEVECDEFIQVSTQAILDESYGKYDATKESYRHDINKPATKIFNENCVKEIRQRMTPDDFLLIPFSPAAYVPMLNELYTTTIDSTDRLHNTVEMGIGYMYPVLNYRVYESYGQMQYVAKFPTKPGEVINGFEYHVVIPNYFDPEDFEYREQKGDYFLYLGRLINRKGIDIAIATVDAIGAKLVVAGQVVVGDKVDLSSPNVEYIGFADVEKRRELYAGAKGLFLPTKYFEPFGGVIIEAAFSGTPVITSDWGAFPELVQHGKTGYRCRTLDQYAWAAKNIGTIKPADCRQYAMANFSLERVKWMYEEYFDMILDVKENIDGKGWRRIHLERDNLDWLVKRY